MDRSDKREYQAIIWTSDPARPGRRVRILATSLEDARRQLEEAHGQEAVYSLHGEDEAGKVR
jgi:hypothetical protein